MNIWYIENFMEKVQFVVLNVDWDVVLFISLFIEEIKRLVMEMYGFRLENVVGKEVVVVWIFEIFGDFGKKVVEDVVKKFLVKQVKEVVEKLDSEIREINREYFQVIYEVQYLDNVVEWESEILVVGKNREKKFVKVYEKFNLVVVLERKECNVGKIVKELCKERVVVENMKVGEWYFLMKGKVVQLFFVFGVFGVVGKGSVLMFVRIFVGYVLKVVGIINQVSWQVNVEM